MTQPTAYDPSTDFEAELGTAHGAHLNTEFSAIRTTLSELLANIALIQRDDTLIANQTVHPDAFTTAAKALIAADWVPMGLWATSTIYEVGNVVENSGNSYVCSSDHISGTFATDHSAGKWVVIYQPLSSLGLAASQIAFTPAGTVSATDVQNAIAELSSESVQKAQNLNDIPDKATALSNLGGLAKTGGSLTGKIDEAEGASISAASTTDLSAATGNRIIVTGAATITSFGTAQAGLLMRVEFDGACTLTHNATSLKLPGGANIVTAAGDVAYLCSLGGGNWKCENFLRYAYIFGPDYIASQVAAYVVAASGPGSAPYAFRNKVINGDMRIDQRNGGAFQTFTAGAALAYCVDRWYGYCTGANAIGQRVAGSGNQQYRYQFTGAASVTAIGLGQRIESKDAYQLAGKNCKLSVDLANSLLTTVTWTAYYANTADAFGTLASPTRTQIATGTFTVNSTVTRYSTTIAVPSSGANGVEIVFSVGAQTSGTFTIGDVQLEQGEVVTPFEKRPFALELMLCQRFYEKSFPVNTKPAQNAGAGTGEYTFMAGKAGALAEVGFVTLRVNKWFSSPSITFYNPLAANAQARDVTASADCSATSASTTTDTGFRIATTGNVATAVGNILSVHWTAEMEIP